MKELWFDAMLFKCKDASTLSRSLICQNGARCDVTSTTAPPYMLELLESNSAGQVTYIARGGETESEASDHIFKDII